MLKSFYPSFEQHIIYPQNRYKKRFNSMGDQPEAKKIVTSRNVKIKSKKQIYNRWFIKPAKRRSPMKKQNILPNLKKDKSDNFLYESLYKNNKTLAYETTDITPEQQKNPNILDNIVSDNANIRILSVFKNKKEVLNKRVPRVIDYIISYHQKYEEEANLKKKRFI